MFIKLVDVHKSFGQTTVLRGLNFSIDAREAVAIRGASGSGKSTLLYLLGGLDHPTTGSVIIDQRNLTQMKDQELANFRNRSIGFVFQFHFLLPSMMSDEKSTVTGVGFPIWVNLGGVSLSLFQDIYV